MQKKQEEEEEEEKEEFKADAVKEGTPSATALHWCQRREPSSQLRFCGRLTPISPGERSTRLTTLLNSTVL